MHKDDDPLPTFRAWYETEPYLEWRAALVSAALALIFWLAGRALLGHSHWERESGIAIRPCEPSDEVEWWLGVALLLVPLVLPLFAGLRRALSSCLGISAMFFAYFFLLCCTPRLESKPPPPQVYPPDCPASTTAPR